MNNQDHYRALENMYLAAPINAFFKPRIEISEGVAKIEIQVREAFFHTAGAVHGVAYFKMLDDAAFFATNSLVQDVFVLTKSLTVHLSRPVTQGIMRSVGQVVEQDGRQISAEAVVYDSSDREIGRGSGLFVRSKIFLASIPEYRIAG
jgi:uncharacterized protein (TIGR00369 family)